MSEEDYRAYVQEVQLLGKIPKPIIVIRVENGYLIVDGEHAWKAATEAGFTEVPCEVIDADRFEAMRQTLARNRHGENDPVLLGRLYELMLKERKLSNRKLADQLGVSEGTIRNHRDYAKAAKLRNRYAPEGEDELISGLNTKQVAAYLSLKEKGNEWLDAGTKLAHAEQLIAPKSDVKEVISSATPPAGENKDDDSEADLQDAAESDEDGEPPHDENQERVGDDRPLASVADELPATSAPNSSDQADEAVDDVLLDELDERWAEANEATRKKFLGGVMVDAVMKQFVRQSINQGT